MRNLNTIRRVLERDIDLLVLEELHVSEAFRRWFLEQVLGPNQPAPEFVGAWHSVSNATGESDLEIDVSVGGERQRILVENKLEAAFQEAQEIRYCDRGRSYIAAGECSTYRAVLMAPQVYIERSPRATAFDVRLTYEAVRNWFRGAAHLGDRGRYRAEFLESAITEARRGWQAVPDAEVTSFWSEYGKYVRERAPELRMPAEEARPATSTYVYFCGLADVHNRLRLVHQLDRGEVRIQIEGMGNQVAQLSAALKPHLERGMVIDKAGKSARIYMQVPKIDAKKPLREQLTAVATGTAAAVRLLNWARLHAGEMGL
jgi:hypothetical protein